MSFYGLAAEGVLVLESNDLDAKYSLVCHRCSS